jgi:hypothetical protein
MATKKPGRTRALKASKPAEVNRQKNIFAWRGSDEFKVWLDELAELNGAPLTVTVEQAVTDYAKKLGHRPKPSRV